MDEIRTSRLLRADEEKRAEDLHREDRSFLLLRNVMHKKALQAVLFLLHGIIRVSNRVDE